MYCDRCGTRLNEAQRFCPSCGKPAGTMPLMPTQGRIAGHVRLLGILWLAISVFRLIPGFFLLTFFHRGVWGMFRPDMPDFVFGLIRGVGFLLLAGAVIGIIAGWGLLEREPWARMLTIVLAFFNLLDMPFGTALGIYTLWVLLPARSEEEYRQISRVA
jgi:zinc-ribbon domain